MELLASVVGLWLGSMFVVSAGLKLSRYDRARIVVNRYGILPARLASGVGFALPWVELVTGVLILTGFVYPAGALFAASLGALFASAALIVLRRGANVPCGCAGDDDERVGRTTAVRALVIVGGGALVAANGEWDAALPGSVAAAVVVGLLAPGALVAARRLHALADRHRRISQADTEVARSRRVLTAPPA